MATNKKKKSTLCSVVKAGAKRVGLAFKRRSYYWRIDPVELDKQMPPSGAGVRPWQGY